ncbi:MAG: phosphoribosylamine--glycine ligase, partial [Mailhella sp.]|nr:phosphoribosylamine--glycine ligase [Mailhella sp.]
LCFCDGERALPLPSAQDHKAVFDGDAGPNTGGMGAYSPAPVLPDSELGSMADITVRPILAEMARRGTPFKGILYAGLMMTDDGPKVLEYNVRFGDPECQPLLMRLRSDLAGLMLACAKGDLRGQDLDIDSRSALGVVLAAKGYPGPYPKGMPVTGIAGAMEEEDVAVFQAGTRMEGSSIVSSGGRVLCVTALGKDLLDAQSRAYRAMRKISMEDSQYRHDIGLKGLRRLGLA